MLCYNQHKPTKFKSSLFLIFPNASLIIKAYTTELSLDDLSVVVFKLKAYDGVCTCSTMYTTDNRLFYSCGLSTLAFL